MNEQKIAPVLSDERDQFQQWLLAEHGLDSEWSLERNCYAEFGVHLAWKSWQAVLASVGAVRDQALEEAALAILAGDEKSSRENDYMWDADDCAAEVRALKGTSAAAVADSQEVSVLAAALALLVAGGFVSQEKADEAIQIALHTPDSTGLPANDAQPSSNPGPLAAVEPSNACHQCNGSGELRLSLGGDPGEHEQLDDCPACNGIGNQPSGNSGELPDWWDDFIQNVAELPDRNSPDGEPDAMIATAEELENAALVAIAASKEGASHG